MIKGIFINTFCMSIFLVTACGGGSGGAGDNTANTDNTADNNDTAQNTFDTSDNNNANTGTNNQAALKNQRLKSRRFDFDANGLEDAILSFSYDIQGRLVGTQYLYSGDGTADILNIVDENATEENSSFTYDAEDRVIFSSLDRGFQRFETTYQYNDKGELVRTDNAHFNEQGALLASVYWLHTYNERGMSLVESFFEDITDPIGTQSFVYGVDGLPDHTIEILTGGNNEETVTNFDWRADGQLLGLQTGSNAQGTDTQSEVLVTYDDAGRVQSQRWTNSGEVFGYSEISNKSYTLSFQYDGQGRKSVAQYDLDSDNSIEVVVTFEWEEAPCREIILWSPRGFPDFIRTENSPMIPGTGFTSLEHCSD